MAHTTKTNRATKHIFIVKEVIPATYTTRVRFQKPRLLTVLCSAFLLIALLHFVIVMHMGKSAPNPCQQLLATTDYTSVVHLQSGKQQMEAGQFVSQLTGGQPSALVQISNIGTQSRLDVYVFGCTLRNHTPTLTTLFSQQGLIQGSASISAANTLIIGEQDTLLPAQAVVVEQPLQQNIYREYAWHNGSLVQVAFPGLYPVASRYEAEQLQQEANNGQPFIWSDPLATAEQMAKDILHWPTAEPQDRFLSDNGITAQVQLVASHVQLTVTLQRLIQHNNQGLWFVTAASTQGITLDESRLNAPVASPILLKGSGALPDGQISVTLFDHTLSPLPQVNASAISVDASGNYTSSLSYPANLANQQGLLLIQSLPPAGSHEMERLLLASVLLA
ncbi:MAG TPA: hypothetical protein VKV40_23675 [Ktedonobacteraceae bacterium]|nr:hypothetical protein [Ktedonobacteraceae bacterium]